MKDSPPHLICTITISPKKGEQQSTPEQDMAEMRRLWAAQKQNPLPSARNVEHWHKIQKKAFREACRKALNRP